MSNYMQRANARFNEKFDNADGDFQYMDNWGADADNFAFDEVDLGADGYENATAPAKPKSALSVDMSNPYIIQVVCGTVNVSSVEVLDANLRANNSTQAGVTFSYGASSITYPQFLSSISSGSGTFEAGLVRIIASNTSSTVANQQVLTTITITSKGLDGSLFQKPIYPSLPGVQYIQNQVDIPYTFMVDGLTSFLISTVYASTTLTIRFYPSKKVNPFKQLQQGIGTTKFTNPGINKMA